MCDYVVVEFGEVGQVMEDNFSVIFDLGAWVIVQPEGFEIR